MNTRTSKNVDKQKRVVIYHKEYSVMLENLMNFISHNIRQPVAHIIDLSYFLKSATDNHLELNKKLMHMKRAALALDNSSRQLSLMIYKKIIKLKNDEEPRVIKKPIIR